MNFFETKIDFWTGCTSITGGCRNCKAKEKLIEQAPKTEFLKAYKFKTPKDIQVCENSDFFHPKSDEWRDQAWKVIKDNPQHRWFICTKYPQRINNFLPDDWKDGYDNVFLGISAERQKILHTRVMKLLEVRCKGRFLVLEPLLERIAIQHYILLALPNNQKIKPFDQVIVGGEIKNKNHNSNKQIRACTVEWIESIVAECNLNSIPCYINQIGAYLSEELKLSSLNGTNMDEDNFPRNLKNYRNKTEKRNQ